MLVNYFSTQHEKKKIIIIIKKMNLDNLYLLDSRYLFLRKLTGYEIEVRVKHCYSSSSLTK